MDLNNYLASKLIQRKLQNPNNVLVINTQRKDKDGSALYNVISKNRLKDDRSPWKVTTVEPTGEKVKATAKKKAVEPPVEPTGEPENAEIV